MNSSQIRRQAGSVMLAGLLLCGQSEGQGSGVLPKQALAQPQTDLKKARKAAERGDKEEAAGRTAAALSAYREAEKYAPQDLAIAAKVGALLAKLVRGHVEAAERYALGGHLQQATEEMNQALHIDPANTIVAERLEQMKNMIEEPPAGSAEEIVGVAKLQPQGGKQTFDLRGDTKTVYEQLGLLFGVKAAFDPDLAARNVRLRLENVDFYTAASVLGTETGTFWRALNPTLLFVTQDSPEKRREYGVQAEQTFALSAAVATEEMSELLRVLRDITGATHIQMDPGSRTITIRDTPERLALTGEIIRELERSRGEVMLEIELLEVDRNTAQKLGVTPPTSARLISIPPNILTQVRNAKDLSALTTLLAGIFGAAATGGLGSLLPPFVTVGGGKSTFLLTLPGAAVDFSDALSLVQSGRQVLLRAQNGKPATFFVGDRFPVTLSLLSGSLGGRGIFTANPGGASNPFPTKTFNAGKGPVTLLAADLRNRGFLDLVAINELDNTLTILLNPGDNTGNFVAASSSPISLGAPRANAPAIAPRVAAAVLTTSGFHDLLVTDPVRGTVIVLLSAGDGSFKAAPGSPIVVGKEPSAIVTGDFDNDGKQDFAVTSFTDSTVSVFHGIGDGTFTLLKSSPIALPPGSTGPVAMVANNFNNDGFEDLAIVTNNNAPTTAGEVTVLLGRGDGTFSLAGAATAVGRGPVALAVGDLNADARPDLAVVNQTDNSMTVLLNHGDGTFFAGPNSPLATGTTPTGIAIADFNGDGLSDVAVTNNGANTFSVFLGAALGLLVKAFEPPAGANPTAIVTGNFGGGALPDVAITNDPAGTSGVVTEVLSPANLFSSATGGVPQQPYPGSEYVDLGVKIKATPMMHPNHEVTLQLEFEIRALAGANINGIPIISNRTITQVVRVKEDEPTLIGGITDREETRGITGLPGFAGLPVVGYALGAKSNSLADTELMILITPHRIRFPDHNAQGISAGTERGGPLINLPAVRGNPND